MTDDNITQSQAMQGFMVPADLFIELVQLIEQMPIRTGHKVYTRLMQLRPMQLKEDE